ncbi:MAG: hypothetical protein ABJC07_11485 [Acidobacteriota bacterium]
MRAPRPRRRAPAKKSTTATARRKTPVRRKPAVRKKAAAPRGMSLEKMLRGFSEKATKAGASLASLSGEGVQSARRAIGQAGAVSKSTIDRITREWQRMDGKKRAQFIAALLAALAAASAPIVRSKLKNR